MNDPDLDSDAAIAAVLHRARSGLAPTASERATTLGRLSATLGGASVVSNSGSSNSVSGKPSLGEAVAGGISSGGILGGAGHGGAGLAKTIAGVFLAGLAVGGGIGFGSGYWARSQQAAGLSANPASPSASASSMASAREVPLLGVSDAAGDELVGGVAKSARPVPHDRSAHDEPVGRGAPAQRTASRPTTGRGPHAPKKAKPVEPSRLASDDEVAFVRRAQKALRNGDAAWALALMRTLDEQLPQGALLTERNVTRVLALCQIGRIDEARAVAERTLRGDRAGAVYASRLAASCVQREVSTSGQ